MRDVVSGAYWLYVCESVLVVVGLPHSVCFWEVSFVKQRDPRAVDLVVGDSELVAEAGDASEERCSHLGLVTVLEYGCCAGMQRLTVRLWTRLRSCVGG